MDSVVAQAHGPAGGNATAQSPETATVNNNGAILVRAKKCLEFFLFGWVQGESLAQVKFQIGSPGKMRSLVLIIGPNIENYEIVAGLVKRLKFIKGNKIVAFPSGLRLRLLPPERLLLGNSNACAQQEDYEKEWNNSDVIQMLTHRIPVLP